MPSTTTVTETDFVGVDVYHAAQLLRPGFLQQADNLFVDGGELVTRPGKQGTLTQADVVARGSAAAYGILPIVTANMTVAPPTYQTWFLFACGGKVYRQQKGATTSTEVLIGGATSFNLVSANVFFEQAGRFVYVVDGNGTDSPVAGGTPVYRISMDASGTPTTAAYVGQLAPTTAPIATLTAGVLDTPVAANWTPAPAIPASTALVVSAATNATPIAVTTSTNHGYATNDVVTISGAQGNTAADGTWVITVTGATTFTLTGSAGNGAYTANTASVVKGGQSNLLPNGDFHTPGSASGNVYLPGTPWTLKNGPYILPANSPDYGPGSTGGSSQVSFAATAPFSVLLDNPADAIGQSITAPAVTAFGFPAPYGLAKAACFRFTAQAERQRAGSKATIALIMTAMDSSNNPLATIGPILLNPPSATMPGTVSATLNFGPALEAIGDPHHYDIILASGPSNQGGNGVWIGLCNLSAIMNGPVLNDAANSQVQWGALFPEIGGTYLVRDFGQAGKDLSNAGRISFPSSTPIPTSGMHVRLGLIAVNTTTKAITGATNASPIAITAVAHGYVTGDVVQISGVLGNTAANGTWTIIRTGADTFTLTGSTGSGAYTSGGTAVSYTHSTINYTNEMTWANDGSSLSVDITTIAAATLASIRYLYVFFMADLPPNTNVPNVITFGPIDSAGRLSVANALTGDVAGPYTWVFTEVNGRSATISAASNAAPIAVTTTTAHGYQTGDRVFVYGVVGNTAANGTWFIVVTSNTTFTLMGSTGSGAYTSGGTVLQLSDVIEGDPSPISASLQMTLAQASAQLIFPTPLNGNTNYYFLYRDGGVLDPGYRLVAILPVGTDSLPSTSPATSTNLSWNHSTRTAVDNVPDGVLQSALAVSLITGRGLPPTGAQSAVSWQGRLWLAKGSTLYASWLIDESNPSALYFNAISPGGDDPEADVKGIQASAGGADNDPIMRLVPLGTTLVILKQRSVWTIVGFGANDFTLTSYLRRAQVGCIAPRAVAVVDNKIWFLGPDGIYEFNGNKVTPVSVAIERLLNPSQSGGTAITAAAYQKCAMLWAGRRLYLFAPQVGDSANTCAYVWDHRQNGWTRFLQMNISGAEALSGGADNADIYMAGLDGQIYQLTGSGDKAFSASSAVAVSWAAQSRGIGQEDRAESYWMENQPTYVYALATTGESAALTYTASAAGSLASFSQGYTFATERRSQRIPVTVDVRGDYMTVGLSGSTITPTRITALGIEYAQGRPSDQ